MILETNAQRLRKWRRDLVILHCSPGSPMDLPENPVFPRAINNDTVFVRNLTRRVLDRLCTSEGQAKS
jgi:hypothetical protein